MKYFLYARKSTDTEDKQVLSIQSQLNEVLEYAKKENLVIVQEFQEARTAKAPGRPIFNEMIKRIEKGDASGIIAWHPDRLARNSIDGGKIIYLIDTGNILDLRFPTYRFDNSAQGKFMLNIIFGQSKYYVDNLSENTKRGLREKLRRGEYPGFAPTGYLNDGKGKIIVDKETAPLVQKLYALCAEGKYSLLELRKLATALGLVSKRVKRPLSFSNVHRILTNPFYYGLFVYKGEIFQGTHSPIINKDLFDKVQEVIKFRSKPIINKNHYFVFRGFLKCGECGCQITAETHKGHNYYHCTKRRASCSQSGYIREENLARQVKEAIRKVSIDDGLFSQLMQEVNREKTLIEADKLYSGRVTENKTQEIDEQLKKLLDLTVNGIISDEEYKEKKAQLINKKFELSNGGGSNGKWLEHLKNVISLAHQATYIATEANYEAQRDCLKIFCSNLKLAGATLLFSYRYPYKFFAERPNNNMGFPMGVSSKFLFLAHLRNPFIRFCLPAESGTPGHHLGRCALRCFGFAFFVSPT